MPNLSRSHDAESDERSAVEINDRVRELLGRISRTKYVLAQHEIAVTAAPACARRTCAPNLTGWTCGLECRPARRSAACGPSVRARAVDGPVSIP